MLCDHLVHMYRYLASQERSETFNTLLEWTRLCVSVSSAQFSDRLCMIGKGAAKKRDASKTLKESNLFIQGSDMNRRCNRSFLYGSGPIWARLLIKDFLFLISIFIQTLQLGAGWRRDTTPTLTIARLHALRVAVLLRVPRDGSHVGHVVTLGVGVGRVGRVARHIRRGRMVLCGGRWRETEIQTASGDSLSSLSSAFSNGQLNAIQWSFSVCVSHRWHIHTHNEVWCDI